MPDLTLFQWFLIEICLAGIALLAARWGAWQGLVFRVQERLSYLAERPALCFLLVFLAGMVVRLALLPLEPVPTPLYHDEFSYLLGADTLAHGRLTNPPLPVPIAFETIHTNMAPTYQSMYLPGPALVLAFGQVLGRPWIAVLLMTALFPALFYWAVSGWLPRGYGLLAGGIALAFAANLNWWFDNYFCLALSCIGTTLVLGSLPRIASRRDWRNTLPLGVGLLALVFTRPYEGFCVAFPCVLVLLWNLRRAGMAKILSLAVAPVLVLALGFAWLLYYNARGTGHALLFPYALNFRTYHITGPFVFSAKHPLPQYRIDMLRRFYIFAEVRQYEFIHAHPWQFLVNKLEVYYAAYLFGLGLLLLAGLVYAARRFRQGLLAAPVLAVVGFAINVVLMGWSPFPQYAAPAAPVLYLLVVFGIYSLRQMQWSGLDGVKVVNGMVLAELMLCLSMFGYRVSATRDFPEPQYVSKDRVRVASEVLRHPGKQLCLVRYTKYHEAWQEWVFNGADPKDARLVWARSLNPEIDREVIAAFPGREVWLVTPDRAQQLVQPYSPAIPFASIEYDGPSSAPEPPQH